MSNLLPDHTQQSVWAGTRARFVAVAAAVLLVSAAFSAAALLPSHFILTVAVPNAESRPVPVPVHASAGDAATTQALIKGLAPVLSATSTPDLKIAEVVAVKPAAVHIGHITYTAGKPSVLTVSGVATDRDAISLYRAALIEARAGAVSVPVSALVGSTDGQFTLTISGDF